MKFELYRNKRPADFLIEETAYSGVFKIAKKVANDIRLVTGAEPGICSRAYTSSNLIIVGTIGKSEVLETLEKAGKIDLSEVREKREVYACCLIEHPVESVECALVIAGSDKRGTIYGLFHISELIGVSPFVDWCNVWPEKKKEICFDTSVNMISKEPSVKYRGFFINDEWPAFGNWCMKNFGGFNVKVYEHVFELLLRLKGNYLWPAMWSARFEDDGPGLANAELADELGVVMGMSHHEPCLRQGEEYRYLRGKDSIYGDAWNFRTNREGITRFWEDGLKRSGKFENVITVGMRGEADTAILGKNATLTDNIALLRDVLKVQNKLIQENVNEDLTKAPRMIALYKEVEEFFYGNQEAKGLIGSEELENVILMLCDDNFGNLRTLPTEEMQKHKGGYGMYYHLDYHGWPISYEWINSSYLPKIWEQMSTAYDFGIRDLWVVNVGDICTQEFPLSYFLDLAYDFEKWGTNAINQTEYYTREWVHRQFGSVFGECEQEKVCDLLNGYTKIAHRRRPEAMNADIYDPVNDRETETMLLEIERLLAMAEQLHQSVTEDALPAYVSLVYYPTVGTLNLYRMQLLTGWNHYFAKLGAIEANKYAKEVAACLQRDRSLVDSYHSIAEGKFYGMGMSEHIGFIHWNEDECQNPVLMQVLPADKPRIMVMVDGKKEHVEGSPWLPNRLYLNDFLEPDVYEVSISLYNISDKEAAYEIYNEIPWLKCSRTTGALDGEEHAMERIVLTIDRESIQTQNIENLVSGEIHVKTPSGECIIEIAAVKEVPDGLQEYTFLMQKEYVSMEAGHFTNCMEGREQAAFKEIIGYGKTRSALKVFPTTAYFTPGYDAPYVEYQFLVRKEGMYEVELYMQPSNPVTTENKLCYGISCNEDDIKIYNTIPEGQKVGDMGYIWADGVLNNIRKNTSLITCKKGVNRIRIYAVTPGFVLEKIVIYPEKRKPENCYLGPVETYYIGR